MQTIPLSEAKAKLARLLQEAETLGESVLITRSGRPAGVLLGVEEYEGLVETLEILADPALRRAVRKGLADIQSSLNYSDSSSYRSSTYSSSYTSPKSSSGGGSSDYDDYDEPTAPKFEPPQSAPRTSGEETAADSANAGSESAA